MPIDFATQRHAFVALLAALLFGISAPLAKLLLGSLPPLELAGILYLGSGLGLALLRGGLRRRAAAVEAPLTRGDIPWLAGAIVCGGVIAPVLLLWGLARIGAAEASLLLNLEGVLTTLIAALLFREAVSARAWFATLLVVAAGTLLAWQPGAGGGSPLPLAAIAGACLLWALDNNLTRNVSGGDPLVIAMAKGLAAGASNLSLAAANDATWPAAAPIAAGFALGFVSYGVSLVLFIYALRHLGSARASAHFGAAPFFGAALSVALLGEPVTAPLLVSATLMVAATWLLLGERHAHRHTHEPLVHTHRHIHDAHHQHAHDADPVAPASHVHEHRHEPITHAHPHLPDLHHRHPHDGGPSR